MTQQVYKKIKTKQGNTLLLTNYDRQGNVYPKSKYTCFWQLDKKGDWKKYMCYPDYKDALEVLIRVKEFENKEGIWSE